jgi:dipeptidyl aminopeptidase/acylaminoacyl peptidase
MFHRVFRPASLFALAAAFCFLPLQAQTPYQKPPKEVLDILNAAPTPMPLLSPARDRLLLVENERYPSISELAEPMLRLAGERINPNTNGLHRPSRILGLSLLDIADGKATTIQLPAGASLSMASSGSAMRGGESSWSADGRYVAFTNTLTDRIELWILETASGRLSKIPGIRLNAAFGTAVQWMPDQSTLLVQTVPAGRGMPPVESKIPKGPTIQENIGNAAPVWTFEDLLKDAHDEDLFDYYATAQLGVVDVVTAQWTPIGKPAVFGSADPSPDGKHLLVARLHRPYSYLVTASSFPREVEVWDRSGTVEYKLASQPLQEGVRTDGVPTGPRFYRWRATAAATLTWADALDGGDPRAKVPRRDRVMQLQAPFKDTPRELARTEFRFAGIQWGEKNGVAFVSESDRRTRKSRTWLVNADKPDGAPRLLFDRNTQDRYNDPGTPLSWQLPNGERVVVQNGDKILLSGQGASPEGNRPFLDEFDLETLKATRIYRCQEKSFETLLGLLDRNASRFLTRFETPSDPPNVILHTRDGVTRQALTRFPDTTPQLRGIRKELVTYKRPDGVQLSFTLYLPAGYKQGERLPTVIWAYPLEYTDANMAGQVTGSPYTYTAIAGMSELFFLTQGYAILDNASMPVVGDSDTVNNTYVEQIVASAKAAIDKAVEMGVTDRNRVGVGGHSYGAFMTANLLSHSNLFKAGIARSGAYNRTLTPFGFQSERRTLWEAPEIYIKMSPFMYADKINTPILLIHGEADNNSGTFPIQSERYYHALKGNGKTVRYVTLPLESHGYAARESIEHTLFEMISWFDRYVKNAPAATASGR